VIQEWLNKAINPCLLLSGGDDSVELLGRIREHQEIDCVTFNQNFTDEQWSVIDNLIQNGCEVHTFPPSNSYIVPNGDGLGRIDEYNLAGLTFPVIREYEYSDRCSLDFDNTRLEVVPFLYDVVFVGTRKDDTSSMTGKPFKEPVVSYGAITFVAPLWDEPKPTVSTIDTGIIYGCSNCLNNGTDEQVWCLKDNKMIDGHKWDKAEMLKAFQSKFQLGV